MSIISEHFFDMIKHLKVENYEALVFYDLTALNLNVLKTRHLSSYENIKCLLVM